MAIKHIGTKFRDVLSGTDGKDDYFWGYEGDDYFYSSTGKDTYYGGDGIDTVSYSRASTGVVLNLDSGVGTGGEAQGDRYHSIENVNGSSHSDTIWGSDAANRIHSRGGSDVVYAGSGDDYVTGSHGNDWLFGGGHNDRIFGGNDGDFVYGGSGDDVLEGGRGGDRVYGGSGVDTARYYGSSGGVTVNLTTGSAIGGDATGDTLSSIENVTGSYWYADTLTGTDGDNVLDGLRGDDVFFGTKGDDTIIGGLGNDTLDYSGLDRSVNVDLAAGTVRKTFRGDDTVSGVETVIGTDSGDTFRGSSGDDAFYGGGSFDRFHGSAGADHFDGGEGRDSVLYNASSAGVSVSLLAGVGQFGDADGDTFASVESVYGSNHDDLLIGNNEHNVINGSGGDDTLQGLGGDDSIAGGSGFDIIYAGSGDDRIIADTISNFTADYIDGGTGFDIVTYDGPFNGEHITVDLAAGTASDGDTLVGIEGVTIVGSNANVSGDAQSNHFEAVGFGNEFDGRDGNDLFVASSLYIQWPTDRQQL